MSRSRQYLSLENCVVLVFSIVVFSFFIIKAFGSDFDRVPGDLVDSRFNNYLAEHAYRYSTGKDASFWSAPFMYPEKESISWSDNFLGQLPIYGFFRLIGFNRETAYQLWMITSVILNYLLALVVFFKLSGNKLLSLAGAFIFTFALPVYDQLYHAQLIARFPIPLAFYGLLMFLQTGHHKYFGLLLFSLVFQFYLSIYIGMLLAPGLFVFFIGYVLFDFRRISIGAVLRKKPLLLCLLYSIASGILMYWLMEPYYRRALSLPPISYNYVFNYLPRIRSYFTTSENSWMWGSTFSNNAQSLPNPWIHNIFPGATAILACLTLFLCVLYLGFKNVRNDRFFMPALLMFGVLVFYLIATLRIKDFSLYHFLFSIPGFAALRDLCRVTNIELFLFGGVLVFVSSFLIEKLNNKLLRTLLATGLLAFMVIDNFYTYTSYATFSKKHSQERCDLVIKQVRNVVDYQKYAAFALVSDSADGVDVSIRHIDAMLASQDLSIPTFNLYTSTCPTYHCHFMAYGKYEGLRQILREHTFAIDSTHILVVR